MAELRLAVVGAGLIGRRHIRAIRQVEGVSLGAVVDPAPDARRLAEELGVTWHRAVSDLPARMIDGVILATPNQLHVTGAMDCIRLGLPVLIEKPIATDVAEARRVVEMGEDAGIPILTGHHRRHNPLIAQSRALIEAGDIGDPVSVEGMFWLIKPDDYFDLAWRREPGAGPIFVNLIHDIDLMRHLVSDIVAVQAQVSNRVRGHAVEETAVVLLEFANGALGTMNISDTIPAPWSWELTSGENPAYPQTDQTCYRIGGTKGALELPSVRLWRHDGRQSWWEPISARVSPRLSADPLVRQIEQFAQVIRGVEEPLVSGREGMRTLQVIEAIILAAREGRRIPVEGD